jgi:hypothetical protein
VPKARKNEKYRSASRPKKAPEKKKKQERKTPKTAPKKNNKKHHPKTQKNLSQTAQMQAERAFYDFINVSNSFFTVFVFCSFLQLKTLSYDTKFRDYQQPFHHF